MCVRQYDGKREDGRDGPPVQGGWEEVSGYLGHCNLTPSTLFSSPFAEQLFCPVASKSSRP
jgi:hypothetical protein